MEHPAAMGGRQGAEQLATEFFRLAETQRALGQYIAQGLSGEALHDEERHALFHPEIEDGDDVRMGQAGCHFRLVFEAPTDAGLKRHFRPEKLDSHVAMEPPVVTGPYLAYPAQTEDLA
jgi:hypothetical protein